MRELDDAALELGLRRVLAERLDALPLELTPEVLERRRVGRKSDRLRRRILTGLAIAAALMIPAGWLMAGAPLPRPLEAIVVTPTERSSTEPTDPPPSSTSYRGVFVPIAPAADVMSLDEIGTLPDGRILVVNSGDRPVPGSILDLATGAFTTTGTPIAWRSQPDVVSLRDGRVLVVGGDMAPLEGGGKITDSTAELFDPDTGTYSPAGPMADSRWIAGVVALADGRVLIVGGIRPPGDIIEPLASAELFDPDSGTFAATGMMQDARIGPGVVALDGSFALVVGGRNAQENGSEVASAELYELASGTFTPVGPPPAIPEPASARRFPLTARGPLVRLEDGRALIVGLACQEVHDIVDGVSAGFAPTPTTVFDPVSRRFGPGPQMPHCVARAVTLPNGEVYVSGWWYEATAPDGGQITWSGLLDPTTGAVRLTAPPPHGPYGRLLLADGRLLVVGNRGIEVFE